MQVPDQSTLGQRQIRASRAARRGSAIRSLPGGEPWLAQVWEDGGDLITPRVIVVKDGAMVVRSGG
ncbi:hypothetical protein DLE60_29915 [Micromonospora globispora]|nr:hypothetical protein DLE60_29915 [Micromonospora globispora]RQW98329.1 hypothetical protein DKL51_10720 [Micromonospora globispora]